MTDNEAEAPTTETSKGIGPRLRLPLRVPIVALTATYWAAAFGAGALDAPFAIPLLNPAAGVGVFAIYRLGFVALPGIAFASVLARLPFMSLSAAIMLAAGDTATAATGAWLFRKTAGPDGGFDTFANVFWLATAASLVGALPSALGAALVSWLQGEPTSVATGLAVGRWLGDVNGVFIAGSVALGWGHSFLQHDDRWRRIEWLLHLTILAVGAVIAFAGVTDGPAATAAPYLLLPVVVSVAFRFGPREMSIVILGLTVALVVGELNGAGPFVRDGADLAELITVQLAMYSILTSSMAKSALVSEQRAARTDLQIVNADLEQRVEERTSALSASNATLMREMAERVEYEERLRFESLLLDSATDSVIVHDPDGRVVYSNQAAYETRGYTRDEFLALPPFGWAVEPSRERSEPVYAVDTTFEGRHRRKDGTEFPVEVRARLVESDGRQVVVTVVRDITERKEAESTIRKMAFYDPLTGLPNRSLFNDRLALALAHASRGLGAFAVAFVDLDHFKQVNDSLGHHAGDLLLREAANRLLDTVRDGDTVARFGGDEFIMLLPGVSEEWQAARVASKILDNLRMPFTLGGHNVHISGSVGIAVHGGATDTADDVLKNADTAMYRAKESGRDSFRVYTEHMSTLGHDRFALKNDLRKALERGELHLVYQPILRVSDGAVVAAEALLRWNHAQRGLIPPAVFIPLAEETGAIVEIESWVLQTSCAQAREWHEAGLGPIRLSVNLSGRPLNSGDSQRAVAAALHASGFPAELLELEITETVAMRDVEHMVETMRSLRSMGVRIAIDDFGTGQSSLERLRGFPVDTLKVDRAFIRDCCESVGGAAIAAAIISLGRDLGLSVVAEGVERREQLAFLVDQGCGEMQGYLYNSPLSAEDFRATLDGSLCSVWEPGRALSELDPPNAAFG